MYMLVITGVHEAGWCTYGYQYATPEAWEGSGNYRSLGYSRPLCIWSMQCVLERIHRTAASPAPVPAAAGIPPPTVV